MKKKVKTGKTTQVKREKMGKLKDKKVKRQRKEIPPKNKRIEKINA